METRGRPVGSEIRSNIIEILFFMGQGYAYEVYKTYREIFPKVTMRSVYYHLNKGAALGVFKVKEVRNETGDYSWGTSAEKIYYSLGENAKPVGNLLVKDYIDKKPKL